MNSGSAFEPRRRANGDTVKHRGSETGLRHTKDLRRVLQLLLVLSQGPMDLRNLGQLLPEYVPLATSVEPGEQLHRRVEYDLKRLRSLGFHAQMSALPDRRVVNLDQTGFVPVALPRKVVPEVIGLMAEAQARAMAAEKQPLASLAVVATAIRERRQVSIRSHDRPATVLDPLRLLHTVRAHDRLVARKVDTGVILTYRLDGKWELELLGSPLSAPVPADIERYTNPLTWGNGAMIDVRLRVTRGAVPKAEYLFGSAIVGRQDFDSFTRLGVRTTSLKMLAEYLVQLGSAVTVVSPPSARRAVLVHLRQIRQQTSVHPGTHGRPASAMASATKELDGEIPSPIALEPVDGRSGLEGSLGALLLALAHLDRVRECTTAELAREAKTREPQLRASFALYREAFDSVQAVMPELQGDIGLTVTTMRGRAEYRVTSTLNGTHLARLGRREVSWEELLPAARVASANLADWRAGLAQPGTPEEQQAKIAAYAVLVEQAKEALHVEFPEALGARDSDRLAHLRGVLTDAIGLQQVVEVEYISEYSNRSGRRRLFPVDLVELPSGWELAALDVEDGWQNQEAPHVKAFNLTRMFNATVGAKAKPPVERRRLRAIYEQRRSDRRSTEAWVALPAGHYGAGVLVRQWNGKVVNDTDGFRIIRLELFPPADLRLQRLAFRWPQLQVLRPGNAQALHHQEAQRLIQHFSPHRGRPRRRPSQVGTRRLMRRLPPRQSPTSTRR